MPLSEDRPTIRLDDVLKLTGAAESGGQAKTMIQGGHVKVNGECELRRGRKLQVGDKIEVSGRAISVTEALLKRDDAES